MRLVKINSAVIAALLLTGCGRTGESSLSGEKTAVTMVTAVSSEETSAAEPESRKLTLDLSESGDGRVLSASLTGLFGDNVRFYESGSVLHRDLVGAFGQAVTVEGDISGGVALEFEYDPGNMGMVPPEDLVVLYYNEEDDAIYEEVRSELDTAAHTISIVLSGEGDYLLADGYEWYSAWDLDVSRFTSHESLLKNEEYGFEMTLPEGMEQGIPGDEPNFDENVTVTAVYNGKTKDANGKNVEMNIDLIDYPACASAESYIREISEAVSQWGQEVSVGSFGCSDGQTAWYYTYAADPQYGQHLGVQCAYPITDTQYIKVAFGYDDEAWEEIALTSLRTFRFYDKRMPEDGTPDRQEQGPEVSPEDITFTLPANVTASPEVNIISEEAIDLFAFDWSGADGITGMSIVEIDSGWGASTEIDHFREWQDWYEVTETCETKLSSGGEGCIAASVSKADGGYFFMGAYDLSMNRIIKANVMLDANASRETYDSIMDFLKSIDIRK